MNDDTNVIRLEDRLSPVQQARVDEIEALYARLMWQGEGAKAKVIDNARNVGVILQEHPDVRDCFGFNEFEQKPYLMAPIGGAVADFEPRPLRDADYVDVQCWLQENIIGLARTSIASTERSVNAACTARPFDPLHDWAMRCRENWDGKERISNLFRDYIVAAEFNAYAQELGEIMMMGIVLRAIFPGELNRVVPILIGEQQIGKSSAIGALCPRDEWFTDELPPLSHKDAKEIAASKLVIELGEMDAMRKSEREELKAFLTRTHENYRPPYGKLPITVPRRCTFIGTSNEDEFLRDATGNTRFYPIEVVRVDIAALKRDRDQLIGEAVDWLLEVREKGGEWWAMSSEATAILAEYREDAQQTDPWEERIAEYLDDVAEVSIGMLLGKSCEVRLTNGKVAQKWGLGFEHGQKEQRHVNRVRDILKRLGWRREGKMPRGHAFPRTHRWVPPSDEEA